MNAGSARELLLACVCHLGVRVALRVLPFKTFLRLADVRLPATRRPLGDSEIERLVQRSRTLCRGSCLTESVVVNLMFSRHGRPRRVTIGVTRAGGGLRAHAWSRGDGNGFLPIWTSQRESRETRWQG